MIFKTTYKDKDVIVSMNQLVGRPFSLIQKLKKKGVGSPRILVDDVSVGLVEFINQNPYLTYINIELRPKGIVVYFNKKSQTWAWCIPFYHLSVYKSKRLSIHAQGHKLTLRKTGSLSFIQKMLSAKIDYEKA